MNEFLKVMSDAVLEANIAILKIYNGPIETEFKADQSPLTKADLASHEIISRILKYNFPGIPVLSEESKEIDYSVRSKWERYFLVDPLDGTKEFIKRNGEFTVNIALIEKNHPICGVVGVPVSGALYGAVQGLPAYRIKDGQKLQLPLEKKRESTKIKVVGSRSHAGPEMEVFLDALKKKGIEIDMVSVGSSLKLAYLAEGLADIYPRLGPTMEWDIAAAQSVLENSGGKVVSFETKSPLQYNKKDLLNPFFIAISPGLDPELEKIILSS